MKTFLEILLEAQISNNKWYHEVRIFNSNIQLTGNDITDDGKKIARIKLEKLPEWQKMIKSRGPFIPKNYTFQISDGNGKNPWITLSWEDLVKKFNLWKN
jgi:hypothetical protein